MKKIITMLLVCFCVLAVRPVYAVGTLAVSISNDVVGDRGYNIDPATQEVTVTLSDTTAEFDVSANDDITDWFNYYQNSDTSLSPDISDFHEVPLNLEARVKTVSGNVMTVNFSGNYDELNTVGTYCIDMSIPADMVIMTGTGNTYYDDTGIEYIHNNTHTASYIINEKPIIIEYKGPYTISGKVGEALTPQIVEIVVSSGLLSVEPAAIGKLLPVVNGMTPEITAVTTDKKQVTVTYTGTPISESDDLIHTTLTKDYLTPDTMDRVIADRVDVKFHIIKQYTVTFEMNGHGTQIDPVNNIDKDSLISKPADPSETGYTFIGWYTDNNTFMNEFDFANDTITDDITLYAKWDINKYTVKFDMNGHGTQIDDIENVEYNSLISKPTDPSENGYIFKGWYYTADCIDAFDFNNDKITANITLYAKWEPIPIPEPYIPPKTGIE